MGRVAKYKKLKSCDPFSKKNPRRDATGAANAGQQPGPVVSEVIWGETTNGRKGKSQRRSKKAQSMRDRKVKRREGKRGNKKNGLDDGGDDGFDLPPGDGDDFDLADLMGSVRADKRRRLDDGLVDPNSAAAPLSTTSKSTKAKKSKAGGGSAVVRPTIPQNDGEEARVARILKLDGPSSTSGAGSASGSAVGSKKMGGSSGNGTASSSSTKTARGRMEGESMRAFERRIREETRIILKEQAAADGAGGRGGGVAPNPDKAERKKEFLKSRKKLSAKKRKKGRRAASAYGDGGSDDDDADGANDLVDSSSGALVTGERAVAARRAAAAAAAFGEQADRPPTFELLPRGATVKKKVKKDGQRGSSRMDDQRIAAEQRAMEAMRSKVRAQYALVKARRKKAGDFHL